jgi:hypothetical protein
MPPSRSLDTQDPERLARRAHDATTAADDVNGMVYSVMGHLTAALADDRDHARLVKAAGFAHQAYGAACSAAASAREARAAAGSHNAEQLDRAADETQASSAEGRVAIDHAMYHLPHGEPPTVDPPVA